MVKKIQRQISDRHGFNVTDELNEAQVYAYLCELVRLAPTTIATSSRSLMQLVRHDRSLRLRADGEAVRFDEFVLGYQTDEVRYTNKIKKLEALVEKLRRTKS